MAIRGPAGISISNTGIVAICVCVLILFVYTFRSSISEKAGGTVSGSKYDRDYKISEVLSAAIYLSETAGRRVEDIRKHDELHEQNKGETKEGMNDPLTFGDLESHRLLVKGFKKAFPALNIVSEEHEEESIEGVVPPSLTHPDVEKIKSPTEKKVPADDITVWIDPLDATKEYTMKLTQYVTVMACIAVKGEPVAGVIRKPFTDETYWAWVGQGTSDNLKDAKGSDGSDPLKVIISLSHSGEVEEVVEKAFKPLHTVEITRAGGAGYKTIEVIKGTQDMYTHITLIKKWDICAGDAILRALGGKQTDLRGDSINYSHLLDPKNEHGLLATMHHHEEYRKPINDISDS